MSYFMIPNQIQSFLRHLESCGFQAYLVGGCVRDGLLNLTPHDWDVCTDALPEELQAMFPDSLTYGMRHGTVTVRWQDLLIEVTTFRTESTYTDHRRPDHVKFIKDLQSDLARRDFTVNAIALDADGQLHDPFGGLQDLNAGIICAVGSPEARFQEDALRMLRAIRFSAQLNFTIEPLTINAILACAPLASELAAERVAQEIEKTLLTTHPERVSIMAAAGLLAPWIHQAPQNHPEKLNRLPLERIHRWCGFSLLLNDPDSLIRLRLDRKTIDISRHCFRIRQTQNRDAVFWKKAVHQYGREAAVLVSKVLSVWDEADDEIVLQAVISNSECCTLSELAIKGSDLKALGFRGKEIGKALESALNHVWQHPDQNERELLLLYLREEDHLGRLNGLSERRM